MSRRKKVAPIVQVGDQVLRAVDESTVRIAGLIDSMSDEEHGRERERLHDHILTKFVEVMIRTHPRWRKTGLLISFAEVKRLAGGTPEKRFVRKKGEAGHV